MSTTDRVELLRSAGFDLPSGGTTALGTHFRSRKVALGQHLFHEGDPCGSLFVVVSGTLEAVTTSRSGRELVLASMGEGSVIGELTIIDGDRRNAGVRAIVASEVLGISRRVFVREARLNPEIGLALARMCADRVRALSEWATNSSFATLESQLATTVMTLASERGADGVLRITQQSLGDRLGVSRESVNKWLRRWERNGIIRLGRGSVTIIDRKHLEAIAVS